MKIIQLFLLAMLTLPKTKAQDTDLDKFYFKTQEMHFPKNNLPIEKRTYKYTGINGNGINFNENDAIKLGGFSKDSLNGVVEVRSAYTALHFDYQRTITRVDPATKITYYSVTISVKADGRILTECKEIDHKRYDLTQFLKSYTTAEFTTEKAALDEMNINLNSWMAEAKINFQKFVVQQTNYRANLAFGFAGYTHKLKLWLLGSKAHPEYENYQQNYEVIKNAFAAVECNDLPKDIFTKLAAAIQYFDSIPKRFTDDSKSHKKMRYSAYYNLMKIYFHTEDFAKAEAYANLVISNDYDSKDGKRMLNDIKEQKELWETNKVTSAHNALAGESGFNFYNEE